MTKNLNRKLEVNMLIRALMAICLFCTTALFQFGCFFQDDDDKGLAAPLTLSEFMTKVEGLYAHFDIVAYVETIPTGEFRTLIISYGFTDLKIEDDELIATESFCHSEHRANQPFTTTTPDEFTQAIIPESMPVEINWIENEWVIWRSETPTLLGIELDPGEALPEWPIDTDDPRLVDDDGDGKPGVTVYINIYGTDAELYIARREIFAYDLRLQPDGRLTGQVKDRSEQLVIGASLEMLYSDQDPAQYEDLSKSPIELVPLEGEYDCERLMSEADELFPPIPEVW